MRKYEIFFSFMMYKRLLKPFLDFILALLGLLLLSPVFFMIMILLLVSNGGQPFFTQLRPGKNERIFRLIKFRTMNNKKDKEAKLLPDAERLTNVGKFIRSTSLDEIPQLFNVIKGDMSLIGPRPLLVKYLDRYTKSQKRRHVIKPGITGWAQVNGRNALSWEEKFELDVFYVDNLSFRLDAKIFFKTIKKVIIRHGVTAAGQATVQEFKG